MQFHDQGVTVGMIAILEHPSQSRDGAVGASVDADLLRREQPASPTGISRDHPGTRINPGRTASEVLHVVDQSFQGVSTMQVRKYGIRRPPSLSLRHPI